MSAPTSDRVGKGRRRGINYLGNLGRMIRDLTGFATLAFELVQNADDAEADYLRFDVRDDALVVFNNAVFSNCGDQDLGSDDCLRLDTEGHRCDFHSFCDVGGGDKQDRDDTTGAFGIGFTAVYQIADTAELISNGLHWFIDELAPEDERIIECLGCPADSSAGTTIVLPWARDANSEFRRRTRSSAAPYDAPEQLLTVLVDKIPTAMLFLRHVRHVELCKNGERVDRFNREDAYELCEIIGVKSRREWLILNGDFASEADSFFASEPTFDARRRTSVSLAVPLDQEVRGLLCAYLPTDEPSRLPVHVNADFFPGSDRRRLLVEGQRGEWNRLALRSIARTLADNLDVLADSLSPVRLWNLLFAAHQAKDTARDLGIDSYWAALGPSLPTAQVMWTTALQWTAPSRAYLLASPPEEAAAVPMLERLGIPVVHQDVAGHVRRMSGWAGAHDLTLAVLTEALMTASEAPGGLVELFSTTHERHELWDEVERLLARSKSGAYLGALRGVQIMPGLNGRLMAGHDLYRADAFTASLVEAIGLPLQFLDTAALPTDAPRLRLLCDELDVRFVLTLLSSHDGNRKLTTALAEGRLNSARLLTWLASREDEIVAWKQKSRIAALPIFPTLGGYRALGDAPLPGGFVDRLGIANAIDPAQIADCEQFLVRLGARKLTKQRYLTDFVPRAATQPTVVASAAWRELVLDLARNLDDIAADDQVRSALKPLPLVPAILHADRRLVPAADAYFPTQAVRDVFGGDVPIVELLHGHETVAESLFRWLGVADTPRLEDVVAHVRTLAARPPTGKARRRVTGVVRYLGTLVHDRRTTLPPVVEPLKELPWLPTERDSTRWYRPSAVQTTARKYLFETQGTFLDLPHDAQQSAADFLHWLGVTANPTIMQVVNHLLTCAEQGRRVNREIFPELSRNATDPAIGQLTGTACLLLDDDSYVSPEKVFRDDNPFGRFRRQLGPDWDTLGPLLDRLGVKKRPDAGDAIDVLIDLALDLSAYHLPVEDPEDRAVIWRCWSMLDEALTTLPSNYFTRLRDRPVIPNADGVLTAPARLIIDDMPGVADALQLGASVLHRREGMWRAFEAAGVRSLSAAVRIHVVQRDPADSQGVVAARIFERQAALARVLDEQSPGRRLDELISDLAVQETSSLTVRYELPAFGRTSDEVRVAAVYLSASDRRAQELLVCTADDGKPWMAVARELARALDPGHAPGPLATTLFVVLSAATLRDAHAALDEAGWPRLDVEEIADTVTSPAAGLGGDVGPDESSGPDDKLSATAHSGTEGGQPPPASEPRPHDAAGRPSEDDADSAAAKGPAGHPVGGGAGDEWERTSGIDSGTSEEDTATSSAENIGGRSQNKEPGRSKPDRRSRLRSYVLPANEETDASEATGRSLVDEAGIRRVLAVEDAAGRSAESQSHNNPGFDVVSCSPDGELLRHIEVKSTDGPWDDMGVGLTPRQLQFSHDHPGTFWLYVVEYATDDQRARIFGISDVASKIEEYRFDDGWAAVAEQLSSWPRP